MTPSRNTRPATLGALLSKSSLSRRRDHVSRDVWTLAVGERIARRTEPTSLKQGTLFVRVSSSVWAQELSLLSSTIVERLREHGIIAHSLRFVVGPVSPREPVGRSVAPRKVRRQLPEPLADRIERIEDPELRRAIEEAAKHSVIDD